MGKATLPGWLELSESVLEGEAFVEALKDPFYGTLWERSLVSEEKPSELEALFLARLPLQLLTLRQIRRVPLKRGAGVPLRSFWLVCTYSVDGLDADPSSLLISAERVGELLDSLQRIGVGGVYLEYRPEVVTSAVVEGLCEAGYAVGIWSGRPEYETPEVVRTLVEAGVSIFNTDEPVKLRELLRAR